MIQRSELTFYPQYEYSADVRSLKPQSEADLRNLSKEDLLAILCRTTQMALSDLSPGPYLFEDDLEVALNTVLMNMALFSLIGQYFRIDSFNFAIDNFEGSSDLSVDISAHSPDWSQATNGHTNGDIFLGTLTLQPIKQLR